MADVHAPLLSPNDSPVCIPSDRQQHYKNPSIYRVPAWITSLNPKAYQPQVVSFGPYHYKKNHLGTMEEHKCRALSHFLNRSGKSLDPFLESLREVAQDLKESYAMLDWTEPKGDDFLKLMMRDGCFMLEIMRATVDWKRRDYEPNDPIFSIHRLKLMMPYISRDMLLLENQLPMEVLYRLVKVENNGQECDEDVNGLVLEFYFSSKCTEEDGVGSRALGIGGRILARLYICFSFFCLKSPCSSDGARWGSFSRDRCLHVLDVFRKGLLLKPMKNQPDSLNDSLHLSLVREAGKEIIRSATELKEAGIVFEKSKTKSLSDISFDGDKGVLSLPAVLVDDTTESRFLNAMTFERLHIGVEAEVTSYVAFMDKIINNKRDVALLHTKGIIQNDIGSNEAVADLFNSLCKEVKLTPPCSLDDVQTGIHEYCEPEWNRWRATLRRDYFGNPWSTFSLIAAFLLFGLTVTQTVYTILNYN